MTPTQTATPLFTVREKTVYCRWSDDNFGCQLYCYADREGGYATHVAWKQPVGEVPKITAVLLDDPVGYTAQLRAQINFMLAAEFEPIALPYAGDSFHDASLLAFRVRLAQLRTAGYRILHAVIERVDTELARGGAE